MDSLSSLTSLVPAPPGAAIARGDGETERIELRDARALFEGGDVLVSTPQEYSADIDQEETKWSALIRKLGLRVE